VLADEEAGNEKKLDSLSNTDSPKFNARTVGRSDFGRVPSPARSLADDGKSGNLNPSARLAGAVSAGFLPASGEKDNSWGGLNPSPLCFLDASAAAGDAGRFFPFSADCFS
jgi:hypothetical protein